MKTLSELDGILLIPLREKIRTEPGWNPRNLSGYLITTMDRDECVAYLTVGTLPNPERTAGRAATLKAGACKYFGKGGDPTGEITMPQASEPADEAPPPEPPARKEKREATPPITATPTPPAAAGLDALVSSIAAVVFADVMAKLPPAPKQELDENKVRGIVRAEAQATANACADAASFEALKQINVVKDATNAALAAVLAALATAPPSAKVKARSVMKKATGKGDNHIYDRLLSLCPVGDNPANHVLIVGPSGTGKTYQAREFAKLHDFYTQAPIGFHKYLEPHHISGASAPADDGSFAFVSGAFRDGFMAASQGKTSCILLDEILRGSPEMQEALLSALDPIPTPKGLVYRYRSGKPVSHGTNGSAEWKQEVIECDVAKLTIIATANIGSNYGVFSVDEAFWKRFRVIRVERNGTDERQIIANSVNHLGAKAIKACVIALDESRRAVKSGTLQYPACIRTLTRCAQQSATIDELKEQLRVLLTEELTGWTEDGAILPAHLEQGNTISNLVKSALE